MTDCIFCKIVAGDIPAAIVGESDEFIAFKDVNPKAPVHLLAIPRRHVEVLEGIEQLGAGAGGRLLAFIAQTARDAGVDEGGYRIATNMGADAGQMVAHLHWHIIGGAPLGSMA
jgi:histidine triad (HIT) family protein